MNTDSFVYETEIEDFYRDIVNDVEKRFDTSGYSKDNNRSLPIGKNKKKKDRPDEGWTRWKNHDRICCLKG